MASQLQKWLRQIDNPAAPAGAQQAARAGSRFDPGAPARGQSMLGRLTNQIGYGASAQSWYAGANREGTNNGWDTGFWDKAIKQRDKAIEEGRFRDFFDDPEATGVVTWDYKSEDGDNRFQFGDIVENGKKVANVYDDFAKPDADMMMSQMMGFDPKTLTKIWGASDMESRLDREIQGRREQFNTEIPKGDYARAFENRVEDTARRMTKGPEDELSVLGAAAGGAALGSFFGPVGTLVGGGIGALGGYMNKDQIVAGAARAHETVQQAYEQNGLAPAIFEGIHQGGGVFGRFISPMSNLVQGSVDVIGESEVGDRQSDFYRVDPKTGEREVSKWLKAADVGASLGDALLQFATPIGATMFTGQMSAQIGGKVGGMVTSGGETFDPRQGRFDNVFTDDDGEFDFKSAAAGIGSVAIDAVQLGMARGLMTKANRSMTEAGEAGVYKVGFADRLPSWAGGTTAAEKKVLAEGGQIVQAAGHRFGVTAAGEAVTAKRTLSLLAPSEQLASLSAKNIARREAAVKAGAATHDDFYRAAQSLASGERRLTSAVVNGFGEGGEEAIQAVMEPWSHNASVSLEEVVESAAYGAAMGVGMSMGTAVRSAAPDNKMYSIAKVNYANRTGGAVLTRDEWNKMDPMTKKVAAAQSGLERSIMEKAYDQIIDDQAHEVNAGVIGADKLRDAVESKMVTELRKLTDRTDGAFVITQHEDPGSLDDAGNIRPTDAYTMASDAVASSGRQLLANLTNHARGGDVQRRALERTIKEMQEIVAAQPDNEEAAAKLATEEKNLTAVNLTLEKSRLIIDDLEERITRLYEPDREIADIEAEVAAINADLRDMYNEVDRTTTQDLPDVDKRAIARAVSMIFGRDPHDSAGSFQMLVPQVSLRLTMDNANDVIEVSHAILKSIRGDYDGDKKRPLNQLLLDEDAFVSLRAGQHYLGADASVNIESPTYEKYQVEYLAKSLADGSPTLATFATETLTSIGDSIRRRYAGALDTKVLDSILEKFFAQMEAGSADARMTLVNGLAQNPIASEAITEFARGNLSNEWLWLDQMIRARLSQFQRSYAAHRPDLGPEIDYLSVSPNKQTPEARTRMQEKAATPGMTIAQKTVGDSMFRAFQHLHYSSVNSAVLREDFGGERMDLVQMAEFYRLLNQDVSTDELDTIRSKDLITGRVMIQLERLAADAQRTWDGLDRAQAMVLVANMEVADFDIDERGEIKDNRRTISLSQLLLKRSVQQDQKDKALVLKADANLAAKHSRLLGMTRPGGRGDEVLSSNAERAFVEIFGSQQLFALLGDDANIFGPHLTVEQWIRQYTAGSTEKREAQRYKLYSESQYIGRKQSKNMPYKLEEISAREISAYRSVVDAMLAAGNARVSINPKDGKLTGELARRSEDVSKEFQDAHTNVREALKRFASIDGRKDGELTATMIQRMLDSNPDIARQVMDLIPNATANSVFERDDNGDTWISNWVYRTFAIKSPREAEMHYYRNILLAELNSVAASAMEDGATEGELARRYTRLPRRMHRIVFDLVLEAKQGSLLLDQFIDQLEKATDLNKFINWVNTHPGVRGDQAPIVPWIDDVAEFDADKAGGGWTTSLQGAEQREAIKVLRRGAENLSKTLAQEKRSIKADTLTLDAIERVIAFDAGQDVKLKPGDRDLYKQMDKLVELSGTLLQSLGPHAMVHASVGALYGIYPQAHNKGLVPAHVEAIGVFDAIRDAIGFVTNTERVMGSLTAVGIDSVGSNVSQITKDGGVTMDDHGRQVEWTKPTVAEMVAMMRNSTTRPLARAILFPQVMERNSQGSVTPQLLVGKDLKSLLNGSFLREMFPKNDRLSQDQALRYAALTNTQAHRHGGHHAFTRAANDYLIAQTSAATEPMLQSDAEAKAVKAHRDLARLLQLTASYASANRVSNPGGLEKLLRQIKETMRNQLTASRLGLDMEDLVLTDVAIDQSILAKEAEHNRDKENLLARDDLSIAERTRQAEASDADFERWKERMNALRSDDFVEQVMQMFVLPAGDLANYAAKKDAIVEYVKLNLGLLERSTFTFNTLDELTAQLLDSRRNGQVDLNDDQWRELSRMVASDYLTEASNTVGNNISLTPFPDADHILDAKYFDPTFSYTLEPFFKADSPLLKGAIEVNELAGQHAEVATETDIMEFITQSILRDFTFGAWTSDIPRHSIDEQRRLDSASAPPAISMFGDSPKNQGVISAATRRTYEKPGEALLSTTTVTLATLARSAWDDLPVTRAGGLSQNMSYVQLNNRFARSVMATLPDGTEVDVTGDAGRTWTRKRDVATSGFQVIHIDRLKRAIGNLAESNGVDPENITLKIEFFHPDDQPATVPDGTNWHNNVYFEGINFTLDGDIYESLNAGFWFAPGGVSPSGQANALDASKKGLAALQNIPLPSHEERKQMEEGFATDLARVIRLKAKAMFDHDKTIVADEVYNAVYKNLKLRHFVRGTVDGADVLWTAEQVIAAQNAGEPLPEGATLWIPSDTVLRSMLGEQGPKGVRRSFTDVIDINLANVDTYRGVTDLMMARFREGISGETKRLEDTRIANRSHQGQLVVRAMVDEQTRAAHELRLKFLQELKTDIDLDRGDFTGSRNRITTENSLAQALEAGEKALRAENTGLSLASLGLPVGTRKPDDAALSSMQLHELAAALNKQDVSRMGWVVRGTGSADINQAIITREVLGEMRKGMRIAPDDLAVLELSTFADKKDAQYVIDHLVDVGAYIVLVDNGGLGDLRAELGAYLDQKNYTKVNGSNHVFAQKDLGTRFQNQRARRSSLLEMRGISRRNRLMLFHTKGKAIQEGALWVNSENERLGAIGVTMNLVPTDVFAGYNIPVEQFSDESQIEYVRDKMRGLNTAEGRTFLAEMSTIGMEGAEKEAALADFNVAFDRLMQRFDSYEGTVLPRAGGIFGTGDIIPLLDSQGHILLYRHGYKAPRNREQINDMQNLALPGRLDPAGIAAYPNIPEPAATTHEGEVVEFKARAGYGLQVELNLPLQVFGDKKQLEWNGMKYILTPMPDDIKLLPQPVLGDWQIDGVGDLDTLLGKEAQEDMLNNHRMAFAVFGMDFLPDIAKFFGVDASAAREILRSISTNSDLEMSVEAADELLNNLRVAPELMQGLVAFTNEQGGRLGVNANWIDRLNEPTVEAQVARAMVIYLSVPGHEVEDVLYTGGLNDTDGALDDQSQLMPRMFTQVFDNAPIDSALRKEMFARFNRQINNVGLPRGSGVRLLQNFQVEIKHADDPESDLVGYLQFPEVHSSGDNPLKNGMSFDERERAAVSQHSAAIAYQAIGAETLTSGALGSTERFASGEGVARFDADAMRREERDGGVWRMLNSITPTNALAAWRRGTPAESERRSLARDARVQFRLPIDTAKENGWEDGQEADYLTLAESIVQTLGLQANQARIVDAWVRQYIGKPLGRDKDGEPFPPITGKQAIEAAKIIKWKVDNHYLPTTGGMLPLMDLQDLQAIYRANRTRERSWAPREATDAATSVASAWDSWVEVALGQALVTEKKFFRMFLLPLDGFMHTYQNATRSLMDLPVSMDVLAGLNLLLPEANRLVTSLDPDTQQIVMDPPMLDMQHASMADMMGGQRVAGEYRGVEAPASLMGKREKDINRWQREKNMPTAVPTPMKDFRRNGAAFIDYSTTTNSFVRSLIHLRVGTALINPALWISFGPEAWLRGLVDRTANLLTGQATSGFAARRQAGISQYLSDTSIGPILERMGLTARYTPQILADLDTLYHEMGGNPAFKGMVYSNLNFKRPHEMSIGKWEKKLEAYANLGSRMQDPTHGVRAVTLARRYMEAVMQHIEARPMTDPISLPTLIATMKTDPTYLERAYPEAHEAGTNAVAQMRSLKETPASILLKSIYEPLSQHHRTPVNITANLVLKLPFLFSTYAMNVATTITGMQGFSDMLAMVIDGQKKPGFVRRWQAAMRGEPYDPEAGGADTFFDMSEIIEGIDLSRSFIRGGITMTGLMSLGLMAGGLGLTGEDEEERRLRRAAEYQGGAYFTDPREMMNDFRNADAVWWGGVPHQMPWIAKQFLSPIIGMERFFDTGDMRHVMWGFQDALGSFPLINTMSWRDAVETAQEFTGMAKAAAEEGTAAGLIEGQHWLVTAVGTYERMLFENSFVNMIYQAADKYDRDPYKEPLRSSDGEIQTDHVGEPRETTGMQPYIDEDGNIAEGYITRSQSSGYLHSLTENRATLAGALQIFSGFGPGEADFWRYSQPIKTKSFEVDLPSDEEAKAIIRSISGATSGGFVNLTPEEALNGLRNAGVGGKYARNADLEPMAERISKQAGLAPMSVLDANGREILTEAGQRAVLRGLAKGSVNLDDASLKGIHLTFEQRSKIQVEWMDELIQEGVDLGLDQTKATARMKRLWYGPMDDPAVQGLGDILWSKNISYADKLEYNQLNTTFVRGPDGKPWATGFDRSVFGFVKPEGQIMPDQAFGKNKGVMDVDERMNAVDLAAGQNLGLRALEPVNAAPPTDEEIGAATVKALEELGQKTYQPLEPFAKNGSGGGGGYRRGGGFGGGGYGGGGSYAPHIYFSKMNPFPEQRAPYARDIPFINTTNPIIRRADIRRERVSSERGRLKQWQ